MYFYAFFCIDKFCFFIYNEFEELVMSTKTNKVEQYLLNYIEQHSAEANLKLPSENALCRLLGVSRQCCRPALDSLKAKGYIYKVKGSGAFISKDAERLIRRVKAIVPDIIAVIVPDLSSRFMQDVIHTIEREAFRNQFSTLVFCSEKSTIKEAECVNRAISASVKGVIMYLADNINCRETLSLLKTNSLPSVFIDAQIYGDRFISVSSNGFIDIENATSRLLHIGHKNIGIICPSANENNSVPDRILGYRSAIKSFSVPFHKAYCLTIPFNSSDEEKDKLIETYLKNNKRLTSVVVMSSALTLSVLKILNKLGKKIPQNISIVGYEDDFYDMTEFMEIKLTAIKQNPTLIGEAAANSLSGLIHRFPTNKNHIVLPSVLTIRNSTRSFYSF